MTRKGLEGWRRASGTQGEGVSSLGHDSRTALRLPSNCRDSLHRSLVIDRNHPPVMDRNTIRNLWSPSSLLTIELEITIHSHTRDNTYTYAHIHTYELSIKIPVRDRSRQATMAIQWIEERTLTLRTKTSWRECELPWLSVRYFYLR